MLPRYGKGASRKSRELLSAQYKALKQSIGPLSNLINRMQAVSYTSIVNSGMLRPAQYMPLGKREYATAKGSSGDAAQAIGILLDASAKGNLEKIAELLKGGLSVNDGDYDKRRPIHLAAAEGRLDVLKYLIQQGADVTAQDRWGNTALDEALHAKQDDIIKILLGAGARITNHKLTDMGPVICTAAAEGNVQHLQRLYDCGVDMNRKDYDSRTPLHVAASEGHASTVEFLLKHGAKVNSVDRFGNTPLSDANRSRSKTKKVVIDLLKQAGAQIESSDWFIQNDPLLPSSVIRSLPFVIVRAGAVHVEAWLPNEEQSEFNLFESSYYTSKEHVEQLQSFLHATPEQGYAVNSANLMGKAWNTRQPIVHDITEKDLPSRYKQAKESGIKGGVIVPVLHNDKPFALLKFYNQENFKLTPSQLETLQKTASGIIMAGVFRRGKLPPLNDMPEKPAGQMAEVYERIVAEEVFNPNLVYNEVEWFYSLGLQKYYFERFSSKEIANHIHAFIAAKKVAATTGKAEDVMLAIESRSIQDQPSWLYMCPIQHDKQVEVENRIQAQIMKIPTSKAYTVEFFMSQRTVVPGGHQQLGLYVLETSDWTNPSKQGEATESDIQQVASVTFLRSKTPEIKARYQSLLASTVHKISPVATVYPTYRDGTTPIMFSFYQAAGTSTSYMLQLTELLKHNGLTANRKFIETFSNGVIVYSLYLQPCSRQSLDNLLKQFSMLHLTPESSLTQRFLSGEYSADQYTYNSAVSRFVYYFLNKRSEEFDILAKAMKGDQLNLGRLRVLQTRLKREAVSQERIYACLANHPAVVSELFQDFFKATTTSSPIDTETASAVALNPDLLAKIKRESTTVLDQQILTALLTFNAHLLKTNFYTKNKASLSFRMDPRFLFDSDWPQVPFGLFFVMGSDFQGFHIRFKDISRGGIRIIRSGDRQAYNHNLESLFAENYGLAYTQNKKNKDIPEFGSKGTILLNLTSQANPFLAFQKYTSGLLDLLIKNEEIIDNYQKEEILFLGPDEGFSIITFFT
jgi:ankyrin repeat protein